MKNLIYILILGTAISCSEQPAETSGENHNHEHASQGDFLMGMPRIDTINKRISCVGEVDVPPQSRATVSAPLGGFIREVKYYPGQSVVKGEVLARVAHPDYVEIQHNYLDAKARVNFLQLDLERKERLLLDNAVNERTLQELQAELDAEKARMMSAAAMLVQVGISAEHLTADNLQSEIILRSPVSGTITQINANLGQHVTAEQVLYEIVDDRHMHIELRVFPRDIAQIKIGQAIEFHIPGNADTYTGEVMQVSRQLDDESGAFIVHAHAEEEGDHLRPGQFVEGAILMNPVVAFTLPEEAVVTKDDGTFVFVKEGDDYHPVRVRVGISAGNRVQILDTLTSEVVIDDAYLLLEAEGGHSH